MGKQMTVNPVDFPNEAKQLFLYLPRLKEYAVEISYELGEAFNEVGNVVRVALESTQYSSMAMYHLTEARTHLDRAGRRMNDFQGVMRELVGTGLLRTDIEEFKMIDKEFTELKNKFDEMKNKLSPSKLIEGELLKGNIEVEMVHLIGIADRLKVWVDSLIMSYYLDPPERDILGFVKIALGGLAALVIFGGILKKL